MSPSASACLTTIVLTCQKMASGLTTSPVVPVMRGGANTTMKLKRLAGLGEVIEMGGIDQWQSEPCKGDLMYGKGKARRAGVPDVADVKAHAVLPQPLDGGEIEAGHRLVEWPVRVPSAANRRGVSRKQLGLRVLERGVEIGPADAPIGLQAAAPGSEIQEHTAGHDPSPKGSAEPCVTPVGVTASRTGTPG